MDDIKLKKGYSLTLSNAEQLIEEADILKAAFRYARAYTLYQLAIEEIGKCRILSNAIVEYYLGKAISFKLLKENGFTDHSQKTIESLTSESAVLWVYEQNIGKRVYSLWEDIANDKSNAEKTNQLKNRSLYVDIDDGNFVSPNDEITIDMVNSIERKAKIRLKAEESLDKPLETMKKLSIKIGELDNDPVKLQELTKKFEL